MKPVFKVLQRIIVREFYREHAGFFLLAIGIGFGFMGGAEHRALAQYFSASAGTAIIPVAIWIMYAVQVGLFNSLAITKPENHILFTFGLAGKLTQWPVLIVVAFQQFLPAVAYGTFLLIMAFSTAKYQVFAIISTGLLALVFSIAFHFSRLLLSPWRERKVGKIQEFMRRKFTMPYPLFYPIWLSLRQPLMLLGVKVFSCLMLAGVATLYNYDTFDERLLLMGCSVAFSSNLIIVFEYHLFENKSLSVWKALPMALHKRASFFWMSVFALLLPEIVVLIKHVPSSIPFYQLQLFSFVLYGLSLSFAAYAFLFRRQINVETFVRLILAETLLSIIMILFQVPAWLLALTACGAGIYWYRKYYYRFEYLVLPEVEP